MPDTPDTTVTTPLKVLLVEPRPDIAQELCRMLDDEIPEVHYVAVGNLQASIEPAKHNTFDLVILGAQLPGIDDNKEIAQSDLPYLKEGHTEKVVYYDAQSGEMFDRKQTAQAAGVDKVCTRHHLQDNLLHVLSELFPSVPQQEAAPAR